jgi:UDP-N-acetyl-2-amino-2-deoxyglucuronate dehydrogenase
MSCDNSCLRCAIVGCGRIVHNHIQSMSQIPQYQIVAICDVDYDKTVAIKQKYDFLNSVAQFDNLAVMLESIQIDLLIVCTPSGLHPQAAITAAKYGCHVLVEKPMATNLCDAKAMIRAFDNKPNKLFVVKQNRYNATIQLLKNVIDSGRMGRIYQISCNVLWTRPQEYYDVAKWRGSWEFDGGAFMNQASHSIDLLLWLFGDLESVQAFTATQARNIEAEDSGVVALKWRNGMLGTINVSMLVYPKNLEGSLTIIAQKATVKIGGIAFNQIEKWDFADTDNDFVGLSTEAKAQAQAQNVAAKSNSYSTTSVYGFGHSIYYQKLLDCIMHGSTDIVSGRCGIKSLELIVAIYKSARDKICVNLPLDI